MYVPYQCCKKSFEDYYVNQTGDGMNYYHGVPLQKGSGFGGLFKSFFRAAVPLFMSGAKTVGKQLLHSGVDVLNDVSRREDVKMSTKRRLKEAGKNLTDKAAIKIKTMIGAGHKKRKRSKNRITHRPAKKAKAHDIFG